MTSFNGVQRVTGREFSVLYTKPRKIVVRLVPGDVIEFREHGRRGRWLLAADTAFKYAVRLAAFAEAVENRRKRKAVSK